MHTHILQAHEHGSRQGEPLLTAAGVSRLRELIVAAVSSAVRQKDSAPKEVVGPGSNQLLPHWDAQARQLWLATRLLKTFRQPAPNQILILEVFQEEQWGTSHIDDPLPPVEGEVEEDSRRRLRETIINLNRGLPPGTIRFHGDGTGEGVRWDYDHPLAGPARKRRGRNATVRNRRTDGAQ